jgi:sirohydrochlorin cobaltochelatase
MYTRSDIFSQLAQIGAPRESVVLMHSSLRLIGDVEGGAEGLAGMLPAGTQLVRLVPLLLTAGSHVRKDLLGDEATSWASRLRSAGFAVDCVDEGLAEIGAIRQLFIAHVRESG